MAPSNKFDLNAAAVQSDNRFEFAIKPAESPEERESRLRREEKAAEHERTKELLLLRAALVALSVLPVACLWQALSPWSSPDDKKWATAVLSSAAVGFLGYVTGKSQAK